MTNVVKESHNDLEVAYEMQLVIVTYLVNQLECEEC
jgi:hypothetical protein